MENFGDSSRVPDKVLVSHTMTTYHVTLFIPRYKVEFREDLKVLFGKAAVKGKPITFLFNDNQVTYPQKPTYTQPSEFTTSSLDIAQLPCQL